MKKNTLKNLIVVLVFMFLIIINTDIYAANFNISLEVDESNQDKNILVLLLKLKDVNFENIISTIEGNLEYNKEVFSKPSIEKLNNWELIYNDENGKFVGFKISDKEIEEEELCKINLKLQDNVKDLNTQIVIKDMKSADGDSLVATEDRTVNVDISKGIITAKEQKNKITDKNMLKYILIVIEIVLVITIITSISYLIQKHRMKKLYEGSRPKNK